ncbi:MAG: hypothetical protein EPN47_07890 [Acidobacteria bacterium]|nr:MAG: hypothetical protein EPN47_07890 [Acidobacteriota bacterium]
MVSGRTAIRQGFRLVRRSQSAVWVLFGANVLLAIGAGLPVYQGILNFTSHSLMSQKLLTGFSVDWLTDFSLNSRGALDRYAQVIMVVGLIALPVNAVLAGGVLGRFQRLQERFSLGTFFRDCGRYAWRMLWLMVIALICYWAVFRFVNAGLGGNVDQATLFWMNDRAAFAVHLGIGLLILLSLAFVNMVIDFAQIRIVYGEGSGFVEAFMAALGFSIGRLPKAIVVYAIPSLCGVALLGIYRLVTPWHLIHAVLGENTGVSSGVPLVLVLLFIGQQLVIFGRYWFRVATWASEWSFFTSTRGPAKSPDTSGQRAAA